MREAPFWTAIVSHRLGKTEDTTIADLAEPGTKATFKGMDAYPLAST